MATVRYINNATSMSMLIDNLANETSKWIFKQYVVSIIELHIFGRGQTNNDIFIGHNWSLFFCFPSCGVTDPPVKCFY